MVISSIVSCFKFRFADMNNDDNKLCKYKSSIKYLLQFNYIFKTGWQLYFAIWYNHNNLINYSFRLYIVVKSCIIKSLIFDWVNFLLFIQIELSQKTKKEC